MDFEIKHQIQFACLLAYSRNIKNLLPVKTIVDRTWIMFEWDEANNLWRAMPAGLAILSMFKPEESFKLYKEIFFSCGHSYEKAAELITGVPAELLVLANKAFDKYPLDEIIRRLRSGEKLINVGIGPRIIDPISDPGK